VTGMPRDGHPARFGRVPVLAMAPSLRHQEPTIRLHHLNDFAHLHWVCPAPQALRCRSVRAASLLLCKASERPGASQGSLCLSPVADARAHPSSASSTASSNPGSIG